MQTTMQELIPLLTNTQIAFAFLGIVVLSLVENLHPFFDFWRSSKTKRNGHYLKNLSIGLINALVITLFFSGLWLWATIWSDQHTFGLLHWLEPFFGNFKSPLRMVLAILFFDFWMYTWHRINHAIPFLWRFHKVHHSDPFMNVTTATRFHVGEIFFSSVLRIGILILFGMHLWELLIYEIVSVFVIQFHHANIQLPERIDRFLRKIIVTPSLHKVHHSDWQPETDSNFGTLFSFWDSLFGTFRIRKNVHEIQLGLKEFKSEDSQRLDSIMKMPLKK